MKNIHEIIALEDELREAKKSLAVLESIKYKTKKDGTPFAHLNQNFENAKITVDEIGYVEIKIGEDSLEIGYIAWVGARKIDFKTAMEMITERINTYKNKINDFETEKEALIKEATTKRDHHEFLIGTGGTDIASIVVQYIGEPYFDENFDTVDSLHYKTIGTGQDGLFRIYCAEEDEVIIPYYYEKIGFFEASHWMNFFSDDGRIGKGFRLDETIAEHGSDDLRTIDVYNAGRSFLFVATNKFTPCQHTWEEMYKIRDSNKEERNGGSK